VRATPVSVGELAAAGRAQALRGIGPGIAARLRELVTTGQITELAELQRELAPDLVGLGRYLGLSARRSVQIARALDVHSAAELRAAAAAGRLREVPGIGPKIEDQIRRALDQPPPERPERTLSLPRARELVGTIARALGGEPAGDPRRWRDACAQLAVVCPPGEAGPQQRIGAFAALPQIVAVLERDDERALGVTVEGIPITLTVAPEERLGTALICATGSAAYVASLGPLPDGPREADVFAALGRPWCPPELREVPGAPWRGPLVEASEIRGDLHSHTTHSDGRFSVEEMGRAAAELGYEYLAICDHTPAVGAVRGLTGDDVRRQGEEIRAVNLALAPFRILRGIECDILPDGRLDLPDDVLAELDWVQISVHAGQRTPGPELTRRVLCALEHPAVCCLSHPTGRLIGRRPENALDLEAVYAAAVQRGVALEVNGLPDRLDLRGEHVRDALAAGARIVCSTDSHSIRGLGNMALSVATARRGGATAADVLNTRRLDELLALRPR
jgi:DNA polymerase (family 10)